jgi:hypothetical protein
VGTPHMQRGHAGEREDPHPGGTKQRQLLREARSLKPEIRGVFYTGLTGSIPSAAKK